MTARRLRGIVPVIPVPFRADESIDAASLRRIVEFVAASGLGGMCLPAYGSEFYKLSESEREEVIGIAIETNRRRLPVVVQANHVSSGVALKMARRYEEMGADLISFALPRQFAVGSDDLLRYCGRICDGVSLPVLIQDFNPGGATIGPDFIQALHKQHPNLRYVKLEEPMMLDKIKAVRDAIGEEVGILEGWGGYYMLEAIPAGCCGVMPGVAIADLLQHVFEAQEAKQFGRAFDLFAPLLPYINFTLQNFELFLHVEKRLLARRGLISEPMVRSLSMTPSPTILDYTDFLLDQMMRFVSRDGTETLKEPRAVEVRITPAAKGLPVTAAEH